MKKTIAQFEKFSWYDVIDPQVADLDLLEEEFRIPRNLLQDCLDPVKLPKLEKVTGIQFYLFRIFDRNSPLEADIVHTLTRKIAVFLGPGFILSVHRMPEPELFTFSDKTLNTISDLDDQHLSPLTVLFTLFNEGLRTFYIPLERIEDNLEVFEAELFTKDFGSEAFQKIQLYRRQLSIIKRLLAHSQDLIFRTTIQNDTEKILGEDLKETLNHLLFLTDELAEDTNSLLSLQISLASQKTNDVVRVLTIFSVFFMPLTFIVGVYGMNFPNMPEIHSEHGYGLVWAAMALVTVAIAIWFRRRGWLSLK